MLKNKLKLIPLKPGCYLMKDEFDKVIYVGKAKNLKSRISSYFTGSHNSKTAKLVNNIKDFEYIVTNKESESLVLELNLIKEYNPKYNIMLKDDKTYPYIEITNELVPRLNIVRNTRAKKSKLFGPYPNVYAARQTVNLLNRVYPLRKCNVYPKTPCLYYHIDQCLGFCVNKIQQSITDEMISEITKFLNGDHTIITKKIKKEIQENSDKLQFEKCIELKEMLNYIEIVLDKQKININDLVNRDIFNYYVNNGYISIQVFFLRRGSLVERKSDIFPIFDSIEEELNRYIMLFYQKKLKPKEIIAPSIINSNLLKEVLKIDIVKPSKGIKKQLLDMAFTNAKISLDNEFDLISKNEEKIIKAVDQLKNLLSLKKLNKIEIFDNSYLFGDFTVSGMVVFEDGKPNKNEYRKYKIKSDVKDDYNIMKEVIYRRYFKVLKDDLPKPDLIIVDGGIVQVNAALKVLLEFNLNIKVIGLKKDDKHKTSTIFDEKEIQIDKKSDLFFLLTRIQDEVHRYTINYHRQIRSKSLVSSLLDNVEGLGPKRKSQLLKKHGSLNAIKKLSKDQLKETLPSNIVSNLYNYLHPDLIKDDE